jgi:hypothetical protein
MARGSAEMVAVGADAPGVGVGPKVLGFTPLAFLWQPAAALIMIAVTAKVRALRTLISNALIELISWILL